MVNPLRNGQMPFSCTDGEYARDFCTRVAKEIAVHGSDEAAYPHAMGEQHERYMRHAPVHVGTRLDQHFRAVAFSFDAGLK
jgi:hypothetical protein